MKALVMTALAAMWVLPAARAQNLPAPLADYVYTPPPGWTTTVSAEAILLRSPAMGEQCVIGLSRIVPSSGDLTADLTAAWARTLGNFEPRRTMTFFAAPHLVHGVAAQGWEYVLIKRGVGLRGAPVDPVRDQQLFGFVMVAKLGSRVASLFGLSLDPLVSSCFGTTMGNVWPPFFASLQFKNFQPVEANGLASKIVGAWESYGSSIGGAASLQYVFTPSGRYSDTGILQRDLTDTTILMSKSFGVGTYSVRGNQVTLVPDRGNREVASIRLEQVSEDGGATWVEKLYLAKPNPMIGSCGQFRCGPDLLEFQLTRRK